MANLSSSFLKIEDEDSCLLCKSSFHKNDTVNTFTQKGWPSLMNNAAKWSNINVPAGHEHFLFPSLYLSIKDESKAFGCAHEKCRITFSSKSGQYRKKFGEYQAKLDEKTEHIDDDEKPRSAQPNTRTFNGPKSKTCFVCTEKRDCDANTYNTGRLRKLSAGDKIIARLDARAKEYHQNSDLQDPTNQNYKAACRYAVEADWEHPNTELYLHQSCYIR